MLGGVSFRLDAGCLAAVTGPNGVGKSTLLRALAGFVPPVSGRVRWVDGDGGDAPLPERLHYVGHADGLKGALTARENLVLAARLLGGAREPPDVALARVGLARAADVPTAYLSAGQRRRLALARLRAAGRPLWLLDEPLTALDAAGRDVLRALMADHLDGGGVILAATHAPLGLPALDLALDAA